MLRAKLAGLALFGLVVVGCEREEEPVAETGAAAEVVGWSPEAEMRATLSDLVHAQLRFYEDQGSFTRDVALLIEEYDFVPVGDVTVSIESPGLEPEAGYLAVAMHPLADQRCQQQHTISPLEGTQVAGEIVCTDEGATPPPVTGTDSPALEGDE